MKSLSLKLFSCFLFFAALCGGTSRAQGLAFNPASSTVADLVINEAMKYIGTPYRWGGKTPNGFDCAGFTRYIYGKFGITLAPSAGPQYKAGSSVKKSELCKGDLVFYGGRKNKHSIGHVGIVTSVGADDFSFIHASSKGVRVSSSKEAYYSQRYIGACRVTGKVVSTMKANNQEFAGTDPAIPIQIIVNDEPPAVKEAAKSNTDSEPNDTLITIAMVGDMMLGTTYPSRQLPKNDGKNLFDAVRDILVNADIAVGNCEGAICEKGRCTKGKGKYSYAFRMPTSYAALFKDAGFDFLSLANNHSNDFDTEGIKETMKMLDAQHIKYAGVKGMCRSAILRRGGITYGFCAFGHNTYTYRHQEESVVKDIIHELRDTCDIVIVSFHGGAEGKDKTHLPEGTETFLGENRGNLRHFAHMCIDEGADLVYGHGPHVCRAVEVYKGHFIAYSLGNFCTPAGINVSGISGYAPVIVARIDRNGMLVEGKINSFIQSFGVGPLADNDNKVAQSIRQLTVSDFKNPHIKIDDDGSFVPEL